MNLPGYIKTCLLIFFCSPGYFQGSAQDTVFLTREKVCHEIRFHHEDRSVYSNSNRIILHLAAFYDISPYRLFFNICFNREIAVISRPERNPLLVIRIQDPVMTNHQLYRAFPVSDVLLPDRFSCTPGLYGLPDSTLLKEFLPENPETNLLPGEMIVYNLPVFEEDLHRIRLSDLVLSYDEEAFLRFHERIETINDYYASSSLLDSLLYLAESTDLRAPVTLPVSYINTMEICKVMNLLTARNFTGKLGLGENDPCNYREKFMFLDKFSRSVMMTIEGQLGAFVTTGSPDETGYLTDYFISRIEGYIDQTNRMNGIRGGIFQEYLDTYFTNPVFADDDRIFGSLCRWLKPEESYGDAVSAISSDVWIALRDRAFEMIHAERYADAIQLLRFTGSFMDHNPCLSDTLSVSEIMAHAVTGVYSSYLGIAESCIDREKFFMAENYLAHARDYADQYGGLIRSDSAMKKLSQKLFDKQMSGCLATLDEGSYEGALECFRMFELSHPADIINPLTGTLDSLKNRAMTGWYYQYRARVLEGHNKEDRDMTLAYYDSASVMGRNLKVDSVICRDTLDLYRLVMPIRYRDLAERGSRHYILHKYEEAYQTLSLAFRFAGEPGTGTYPELDSIYRETLKHHFLNDISMATGMIWQDRIDQARSYIDSIGRVLEVNRFEDDPDLAKAVIKYRRKIDAHLCSKFLEEAEILITRAGRNTERGMFDKAVSQYGEARLIIQKNPACLIRIEGLDDTIGKYIPAAWYQEIQKRAEQYSSAGKYSESFRMLVDNERFYREKDLSRLNVPFVPVYQFVRSSGKIPLAAEAVKYYTCTGNPGEGYEYLILLRLAGVNAKDIRGIQEDLGRETARRDFPGMNNANPVDLAGRYTGGNRWFAGFQRGYISEWKHLYNQMIVQQTHEP
jgi:hypothetical protein